MQFIPTGTNIGIFISEMEPHSQDAPGLDLLDSLIQQDLVDRCPVLPLPTPSLETLLQLLHLQEASERGGTWGRAIPGGKGQPVPWPVVREEQVRSQSVSSLFFYR